MPKETEADLNNHEEGHPRQRTEKVRVTIETCTCTIMGNVHPPAIAYRSRLSDLLNQKGVVFLNITDATVYSPRGSAEPAYTTSYIAVNLSSIDVVRPMEED